MFCHHLHILWSQELFYWRPVMAQVDEITKDVKPVFVLNEWLKKIPEVSRGGSLDVLRAADPSPDGRNISWLASGLDSGTIDWQDIVDGKDSKAYDVLDMMAKHKKILPPDERNVEVYKNLDDIKDVLHNHASIFSTGLTPRMQNTAISQTDVVYKKNGLTILSPKTFDAMKALSRGTQWTTKRDNVFSFLNKRNPVIIIQLSNLDKLQLTDDGRNVDLVDIKGKPVSMEYIDKNWKELGGIIESMDAIKLTPRKHLTPEMCERAIELNPENIQHVPEDMLSDKMIYQAITQSGDCLKYIPKERLSYDMCMEAVQHPVFENPLDHVPKNLITSDMEQVADEAMEARIISMQQSDMMSQDNMIYDTDDAKVKVSHEQDMESDLMKDVSFESDKKNKEVHPFVVPIRYWSDPKSKLRFKNASNTLDNNSGEVNMVDDSLSNRDQITTHSDILGMADHFGDAHAPTIEETKNLTKGIYAERDEALDTMSHNVEKMLESKPNNVHNITKEVSVSAAPSSRM